MFELTDDGTLDTVVRCSDCGEELRYNYDAIDDCNDAGGHNGKCHHGLYLHEGCPDCYSDYVKEICEQTTNDHECSADACSECSNINHFDYDCHCPCHSIEAE